MIFHRISIWWLFLPLDQRWTGLERRELGIGWCFLISLCLCFRYLYFYIIGHIWACPRDQRWKVQAPWEREMSLWPVFLSILFFIYSILLSIECFFQHWKVQADRKREKKTLWPNFYLFFLLIPVFTYLCFVICDFRYLAGRPFYIYVWSFAYFMFIIFD